MAEYKSPNGAYIKGTLETLSGVALINGIDESGEPEHCGETEIYWDEQKTVERDGKPVYVDTEGSEWTFDQLTKVEDD
jgi:hypothetical protein